jgi:hypothetical protein
MKLRMKWGVVLALLAGVIAAVYLVWSIGFDPVWDAVAQAGFDGLALLCLYSAVIFVALAFAWYFLVPPPERSSLWNFYIARLVRDSIAEISPFSPVGGMVAAARLMILKRMTPAYAAGSVAADATTEAMAQVVFLAFGLGMGLTQFRNMDGSGALTLTMIAMLLLAVPGIALLIFLQKRGAGFAERLARKFFPQMQQGVSFHEAILELYNAPSRLAASAGWHLIAWIGSGRRHLHLLQAGGRRDQPAQCHRAGSPALHPAQYRHARFPPPSGCRNGAMPCWRRCSACRRKWAWRCRCSSGRARSCWAFRRCCIGRHSKVARRSPRKRAAMSDVALVTGASGFVGSAVARALVARGLHVRVLMRATLRATILPVPHASR